MFLQIVLLFLLFLALKALLHYKKKILRAKTGFCAAQAGATLEGMALHRKTQKGSFPYQLCSGQPCSCD